MWYGHGFSWGWMVFGGLMMLLFWGGFFALVAWAIRGFASKDTRAPNTSQEPDLSAREILDRRYASGEITREQYESMKQDLAG